MQEPAGVFKVAHRRHFEQAVPQAAYMPGRVPRAAAHRQALRHEAAVRRAAGAAGGHSLLVLQALLRGASEGGAGPERSVRVEGGVHTRRAAGLDPEQHLQEELEDRAAGRRQAVDHVQSAGNRQQTARRRLPGFLRVGKVGVRLTLHGRLPAAGGHICRCCKNTSTCWFNEERRS